MLRNYVQKTQRGVTNGRMLHQNLVFKKKNITASIQKIKGGLSLGGKSPVFSKKLN